MKHIGIHEREFLGAKFRFYETDLAASLDTFADEQEIRDAWWRIGPGDVVVDAGAGMGSYTLPACALGASRIFAFCPELTDREILLENISLNGYRQCDVLPIGLYDRPGFIYPNGNRMLFSDRNRPGAFPVFPLDRVGLPIDRLDYLKIDVEGVEEGVLEGATRTIQLFRPRLLIECHSFMDARIEEAVRRLIWRIHPDYKIERLPTHAVVHLFAEPYE